MNIIDGQGEALKIFEKMNTFYQKFIEAKNLKSAPKLAIVSIGEDARSAIYVERKIAMCQKLGFDGVNIKIDSFASFDDVKKEITKLNKDDSVNGIIVQMPLPSHLDVYKILDCVDSLKDVDGLSMKNIGMLSCNRSDASHFHSIDILNLADQDISGDKFIEECIKYQGSLIAKVGKTEPFIPCTPLGIHHLLSTMEKNFVNKNVVILGKSNIVGRPIANILLSEGANVTMLHSKTEKDNLVVGLQNADIVIIATGKHGVINYDMFEKTNKKVIIIDVGINIVKNSDNKIIGDIDFASFENHEDSNRFYITPVPKGVGPMTIISLMSNVLMSFVSKNI